MKRLPTVHYNMCKCPTRHDTGHFGDNLPSLSLGCCKHLVLPTNCLADTSQQDAIQKLNSGYKKNF